MRSANARYIAEFCARQYESRSCALMRGIDFSWHVDVSLQHRAASSRPLPPPASTTCYFSCAAFLDDYGWCEYSHCASICIPLSRYPAL